VCLTVEVIICSTIYITNFGRESDARFTSKRRDWRILFGLVAPLAIGGIAVEAQEAANLTQRLPDKSIYNLFNPTPRESMREMNTDRPDQTESPYTVDAGHFQLEMDFVSAEFDRDQTDGRDLRTESWNVAPMNLKVGLLNNVDLQFLLDTYRHSRVEDHKVPRVTEASGFGDVTTRLKINFWGNDGGKTAFGFISFIKWPFPKSGLRNGKTEGGLIFPLSVGLAKGWDLGAMTEFDFVRNDAGNYDTEFVNSVTVGHELTERLGMYLEFFTVTGSAKDFPWQGQVDVGWTYAIGENAQLDCGCNFGVTGSAPDFGPFAGFSFRF
jgi:hypothetical protein